MLAQAGNVDDAYVNQVLPGKMRYNLYAVKHFSFWFEIRTMFRTVFAVMGKNYGDPLAENGRSN